MILSGGSGTRLWPLSRGKFPKQFVPNLNAPIHERNSESLLAQTLLRLEWFDNLQPPTILCNESHRFLVADELARTGMDARAILLEPVARNTAPTITVAAISAVQSCSNAILVVMPSDHAILDAERFHAAVQEACAIAAQRRLVLLGITPHYPHTGYGYIRRGPALSGPETSAFHVEAFFEKPTEAVATDYLDDGNYYWNSGLFVLHGQTFLDEVRRLHPLLFDTCHQAASNMAPDLCFLRIDPEAFARAPAISVDYAIMEKTDKAVMVPMEAGWSDVGSWSAIRDLGAPDGHGNVTCGPTHIVDTQNSYAHSDGPLIALLGVEDLVVVGTPDAVLVASADRSQDVGKLVTSLKEAGRDEHASHRRHYRPWGTIRHS